MEEELFNYLKELNIEYKEYRHKPVFTVEEHEKVGNIPGMHTKSLFLKSDLHFYLVCI